MRIVYRIVHTDPPELIDFMSNAELGRPPRRATTEVLRLWSGISVYETEQQAREKAIEFSRLGSYLARLAIPANSSMRIERTTRSEGHHTIWAPAEALLRCVVGIVPV